MKLFSAEGLAIDLVSRPMFVGRNVIIRMHLSG